MHSVPPQNPGVHLVGQQEQQQRVIMNQMVINTYLGLIPVVASAVLQRTEMYDDHDAIPDRIADEAWRVTRAAVKKIGIEIPEEAPNGE